jgi:hypothetical protein
MIENKQGVYSLQAGLEARSQIAPRGEIGRLVEFLRIIRPGGGTFLALVS